MHDLTHFTRELFDEAGELSIVRLAEIAVDIFLATKENSHERDTLAYAKVDALLNFFALDEDERSEFWRFFDGNIKEFIILGSRMACEKHDANEDNDILIDIAASIYSTIPSFGERKFDRVMWEGQYPNKITYKER